MITPLSKDEQETIINISRDSDIVRIYCSDPIMMRRFDKLCEEQASVYSCTKIHYYRDSEEICSKEYEITEKKFIKFSKKRELTEEQLAELKERGQQLYRKRIGANS